MSPRKIVIANMVGAVPERCDEIVALWERYDPKVVLIQNRKRITLHATKEKIEFDAKTMEVFWLIGFSGWRAIECYSPHVICSASLGKSIHTLIQDDRHLAQVELAYRGCLAAVRSLIDAVDPTAVQWPPDLPRPNACREAFAGDQYKAAFDLTCLAVAFALFHEFRHVMLDRDVKRPSDRREEELACDVWAREFMTSKLATYAADHGHSYDELLRKRSMGFAMAALILHEITPQWDHGGNQAYFSVGTRLNAILSNTPLPEDDHFWVLAASLLIGMFRQSGRKIEADPMSARALTTYLLEAL